MKRYLRNKNISKMINNKIKMIYKLRNIKQIKVLN